MLTTPATAWRRVHGLLLAAALPWAIFTVLLYAAAGVLVVVAFPDVSNLWVSIFVLAAGFTSGMTALLDLLTNRAEQAQQ